MYVWSSRSEGQDTEVSHTRDFCFTLYCTKLVASTLTMVENTYSEIENRCETYWYGTCKALGQKSGTRIKLVFQDSVAQHQKN